MKKILSTIFGIATIISQSGFATVVSCEVTAIDPPHANFFALVPTVQFPPRPQIGDKTELDLSGDEITDISFESGNALPIKAAKATLTKKHEDPHLVFFSGTQKGLLGRANYEGRLRFRHSPSVQTSYGDFQLVRTVPLGMITIHSLRLKCTH